MKNPYLFLLFFALTASAQQKMQVFFDFDKDVPNESSSAMLADWIKANPKAEILKLSGYCDSVDTNGYNIALSSRRIQSTLEILKSSNINVSETIELKPYGEDFNQSPNQADNRRVDIFFSGIESKTVANLNTQKAEAIVSPDIPDATIETKLGKAKVGDLIRIQNINFFLNSEVVVDESVPKLDELYDAMLKNPKLSIEIHGHICCNPDTNDTKLSFRRAKYILTYLNLKGIPINRLAFKGFGSSRPIYPIPEKTYKEEAENRRVEILIVAI